MVVVCESTAERRTCLSSFEQATRTSRSGGRVAPGGRAGDHCGTYAPRIARTEDQTRLEAEGLADRGRAERLRGELDVFVAQVSQRFGSRARTRGPAETARKAVTKVLRTQIAKLLDVHPNLGEHLRETVQTGVFCSYAPTPATGWEVSFST